MSIGSNVDDAKANIDASIRRMPWNSDQIADALSESQAQYDAVTGIIDYLNTMSASDAVSYLATLASPTAYWFDIGAWSDTEGGKQSAIYWSGCYDAFSGETYADFPRITEFLAYIASGGDTAEQFVEDSQPDVSGMLEDDKESASNTLFAAGILAAIALGAYIFS